VEPLLLLKRIQLEENTASRLQLLEVCLRDIGRLRSPRLSVFQTESLGLFTSIF
jgi:hypothetical protein